MKNGVLLCVSRIYWFCRGLKSKLKNMYFKCWYFPRNPEPVLSDEDRQELMLIVEEVLAEERAQGPN